jgi:biotin transport system substrate-specific component
MLGGILLIYAVGVPVLAAITAIPLDKAALSALAYIPGDLIKAYVAAFIAVRMKKNKPIIQPKTSYSSISS